MIIFKIVAAILGFVNFVTAVNVSLTTAKAFNSASPKTTIFFQQSSFGSGNESTPIKVFPKKESLRRSKIESIWDWDYWCQLQPKAGNCTNTRLMLAYYYDTQLDQCLTFDYSGCGGNKNNFRTLIDCENYCKGTTYIALTENSRISFCALQPNAGLCLSLNDRYYYDVNAKVCKKFVYGGCGGNQNRFKTYADCSSKCVDIHYK